MAVTFSGTTPTYLSTTNVPASQTIKGSPFTFAMWVYCTGSGGIVTESAFSDVGVYMGIVGSGITGSTYHDSAVLSNSASIGTFYLDIEQNSFAEEMPIQGNATTVNVWRHYAATYDGSNTVGGCKIYENGAAVTPASTSNSLSSTVAWNRIIVGGFNGAGQDAWMFNRVLSAAEIGSLYSSPRRFAQGVSLSSLVGYWPLLNGGSAGVDFSGNGRNLTATGSVTDSTLQPNHPWGGRSPLIIITPAASAITIAGTSTTASSATAAVSFNQQFPINATASTASSATAAVSLSQVFAITATATTKSSAAATNTVSIQQTATGTTASSASAAIQIGISATGTTASSATAAVSLSTSTAITAAATTASSATAAVSFAQVIPITAAAQTASSATSAVSSAQVIAITAAATTASNAAASFGSASFQLSATGTTRSNAQGAIGSLLMASATTASTGTAAFTSASFPLVATGTTASSASATMTSSGGGGGGGVLAGLDATSSRRWLGGTLSRRRVRG